MRVAIVAESFLPHVNGVTNSVLRVIEHLEHRGHEAVVIAAGTSDQVSLSHRDTVPRYGGAPIVRTASLPLPRYPQVRLHLARTGTISDILTEIRPDVVHLASPFFTGIPATKAAQALGIPSVAVYQTDVASFAERYGLKFMRPLVWRHLRAIHHGAERTLAPSRSAIEDLISQGIPRVHLWQRGVNSQAFSPEHRSVALHDQWAPRGEVVVGYLGRLAPEKRVEDLAILQDMPGVRLVVIGDGPSATDLHRRLPRAHFTGQLTGMDLSRAVATVDVMVHTGPHETFCQSVQEALSSGVPVVSVAAGGPLDLVDHSRSGWLYPVGDLDALREGVRDLVGDARKRSAMGRFARESVRHRTWESIGDQLLAHYDAVRCVEPASSGSPRRRMIEDE